MKRVSWAFVLAILCSTWTASYAQSVAPPSTVTAEVQTALDRISADSMRGHLSFIASDLLQGRATPSPGLDIAAEYIAAQFRRAGLEPGGDDGYFQTSERIIQEQDVSGFELHLKYGDREIGAAGNQAHYEFSGPLALRPTPVVKVDARDTAATYTAAQVEGKVVLTEQLQLRGSGEQMVQTARAFNELLTRLAALKPSLIVILNRRRPTGGIAQPRVIEVGAPQPRPANLLLELTSPDAGAIFDMLPSGATDALFDVKAPALLETRVKVRNVIALLRGSDPVLQDTYVLLTAHYDHIGVKTSGEGDRIFNGANDNGSGTVSVMEIAASLAAMKERPKRSILFIAFFGEEEFMQGSDFYGRHPIVPIEKTIADINLEQMGRTDSSEGPQMENASITGFDYSDMGSTFKAAGGSTGINVYKHATNSDLFYGLSDNISFADLGVPAHTICVAFEFPDVHDVGDQWEKIDYNNMAKVDRMVALALVMIANNTMEPQWTEGIPQTARYLAASKKRHGL